MRTPSTSCDHMPRPDQVLEVQVPDVARVVVAGHREHRRLDALGVRDPVLVLLPVALGREVAAHHDDVGLHLVQLRDHPVHQVGHEELRADVRIRDVGDRDHGCRQSSGAPAHSVRKPARGTIRAHDLARRALARPARRHRLYSGYRRGAVLQVIGVAGLIVGVVVGVAARAARRRGSRARPPRPSRSCSAPCWSPAAIGNMLGLAGRQPAATRRTPRGPLRRRRRRRRLGVSRRSPCCSPPGSSR